MSQIIRALVAMLMLVAIGDLAAAGSPSRGAREVPLKDCTRVNGRFGYYANPWCSPSEQLRWDRAEARRFQRAR